MENNIFAFTDPTSPQPGYISINERDHGAISVSVRTQGANGCSEIVLDDSEVGSLIVKLARYYSRSWPKK